MARNIHLILSDIECYQESADWLGLDALLEELFLHPVAQIPATTLLGVFERFPESEGCGVFWSIIHGLEALPEFEIDLYQSIKRKPSTCGFTMVLRILNSEECVEKRNKWIELLSVVSNQELSSQLKEDLENICKMHPS